MALTVNTNIASLIAQKNLNNTNNTLTKSVERLSTGLRINRAADDAAGLALSTTLKAQIRSINQAGRNANDAVSLLQTAESGMGEMSNITLRMRELAEQAANEVLGDTERGYLNDEYLALKSEINRISDVTEFAGKKLLDGTISAGVNFQIGFQNTSNDRLSVSISDTDAAALGLNTSGADSISTAALAQSALSVIDASAITVLSSRRGDIGAVQEAIAVGREAMTDYEHLLCATVIAQPSPGLLNAFAAAAES
jgi:flagellin